MATLTSSTNASTAELQFSAYGSATVQLAVTDDAGAVKSTQVVLTAAPPAPAPEVAGGGGGGGGALQFGWLLAWLIGVAATRAVRPGR